jgi:NAD dependent epimerase/dehydratase family enzyme
MSWISLEDAVRALRFVAETSTVEGAVNLSAPAPVRSVEFTRALGRALHRPTIVPAPAFALKLVFGEMAEATILASQRVVPERLAGAGFEFRHPRVEDALAFELRR